jgi:hypothetical protein
LFTIKGNLVFMNTLYHKVAVASVCTALGFALGANKEAKAATFTLSSTITSEILDVGLKADYLAPLDGLGDTVFPETESIRVARDIIEIALLSEFNIASFSSVPNTVISSAVLQVEIRQSVLHGPLVGSSKKLGSLGIFGYVGNGTVEASDFEAGVFLNSVDVSSSSKGDILNFNLTPFVNQRVSNGDAFAGFGLRALGVGGIALNNSNSSGIKPRLIVETTNVAEPVPEPTTIFGSAIALGVGGWLKRKKSSQLNKTKSQN